MNIDILANFLRWLHILAAVALVGGAIFQRIALIPALSTLPEDQRNAYREAIRKRWAPVVWMSIVSLLISGTVGIVLIVRQFSPPAARLPSFYHMLFGIKFLLAMVVFFLASVLAGRSQKTKSFRDAAPRWLTAFLLLATLVICLGGVLRSTHLGPNAPTPGLTAPSDS